MATWHDYLAEAGPGSHSVTGTLKVLADLYSPQLDNRRDILVYLPPSYDDGQTRSYPVLYMHDGQNLFDDAASYAGEWHADESMEMLAREGLEGIVVGIPSMGDLRVAEYTPFRNGSAGGGLGRRHVAFVADTVKPLIDADFRTQPDRSHTAILGSSLGGLMSLYALFDRPDVFGLVGALSPSLADGRNSIFGFVETTQFPGGCIYMDVGTREAGNLTGRAVAHDWSQSYLDSVRRMYGLLESKGYRTGEDLLYVEDPGGIHHESAWARRLPAAIRFLLRCSP